MFIHLASSFLHSKKLAPALLPIFNQLLVRSMDGLDDRYILMLIHGGAPYLLSTWIIYGFPRIIQELW